MNHKWSSVILRCTQYVDMKYKKWTKMPGKHLAPLLYHWCIQNQFVSNILSHKPNDEALTFHTFCNKCNKVTDNNAHLQRKYTSFLFQNHHYHVLLKYNFSYIHLVKKYKGMLLHSNLWEKSIYYSTGVSLKYAVIEEYFITRSNDNISCAFQSLNIWNWLYEPSMH